MIVRTPQQWERLNARVVAAVALCALVSLMAVPVAGADRPSQGQSDQAQSNQGQSNQAQSNQAQSSFVVDAIFIEGLDRTERHIVDQALGFEPGQRVSAAELEAGAERLREMQIFARVDLALLDQRVPLPGRATPQTDHRIVHVRLEERVTLVPIIQINRGGDLFAMTLGLGDTNVFGRNVALGAHYQRLDQTNSVQAWAEDPRFFADGLSLSVDLGWTRRPRILYGAAGEVQGGYLRFRRAAETKVSYRWSKYVSTGIGLEARLDEFSADLIPEEAADQQASRGLPGANRAVLAAANVRLGHLEARDYLLEGVELRQRLSHAAPIWGSQRRFTSADTELLLFGMLPLEANLAARLSAGITSATHPEERYFLGGFSHVRGFADSRFRGPMFWLANLELRLPSLVTELVVVQPVGFFDMVAAAERLEALWPGDGASAGAGVRLILPKLRGLTFRFDYGWALSDGGRGSLSFGTGQYF